MNRTEKVIQSAERWQHQNFIRSTTKSISIDIRIQSLYHHLPVGMTGTQISPGHLLGPIQRHPMRSPESRIRSIYLGNIGLAQVQLSSKLLQPHTRIWRTVAHTDVHKYNRFVGRFSHGTVPHAFAQKQTVQHIECSIATAQKSGKTKKNKNERQKRKWKKERRKNEKWRLSCI